ncbi:MAG: D-2-hydroxyacid dehydrogenase, partial [Bacteroidota bacterium]|nr:D-2-hydroxyacid dehydrogenase [Bacteroidota bacterium]
MRVHANDGISAQARKSLSDEGFNVTTDPISQEKLAEFINQEKIDVFLVRSATKVRKDLIDACPSLKLIGRGGVGLDNIDVAYAKEKGISVINTPAASTTSVAELVIAHLFTLMRNLHKANRRMPAEGRTAFKELKKEYEKGAELRGKTLGVIGFGRIGRCTAGYALGCGMKVIYVDHSSTFEAISVEIGGMNIRVPVRLVDMPQLLAQSDAITIHVPAQKDGRPTLGEAEFAQMKKGVVIVNTARGGVVDEDALIAAIKSGKVRGAALDVFVGEPQPRADILAMEEISLSPHIGGATIEAQDRVGDELADQIISWHSTAD